MSETEQDHQENHQEKPQDRKLGDQWTDWKGSFDSRESEINEKLATFFLLAFGIIFIFLALLPVVWYLIKPRIMQLSASLSNFVEWAIIGFSLASLMLFLLEAISVLGFRKSIFPYRWREKFILFLLPKTVWLGTKLGISRDRVGNSFIKVHNFITKSFAGNLDTDRLLILLPRCLKRETRNQIMNRVNGNGFKVVTAGGGEQAREAIKQYRPTFILALACERDLMSGILDVAEKIPVLAIPNKRPEGPCKNTDVYLDELDETLRFITDRRNRKAAGV
jgi:hypothetical protein